MTVRRILFVSEVQATRMHPPKQALLISITDPGKPVAQLRAGWQEVLRLQFHDVDELTFPGQNLDLKPISVQQATQVATFIRQQSSTAARLVVHCKSGVSRSAGVARAAASWLGVPFPLSYFEFNKQVHSVVSSALGSARSAA